MALEVTGKLVQVLDLKTGTSARGDWKKQDFILETEEQYPRKICISLWADRVADIIGIQPGELITASINLESREYNGSWYTDVRAWRIGRAVPQQATQSYGAPASSSAPQTPPPPPVDEDFSNPAGADDLPF